MVSNHPVFRRVAAGTHADLLTIEREWDEKKKRLKKSIAAETARSIPPFLHLTPAEGGFRVVIVDGAEDLNPQSANALLKVLEEPPPKAVLMLVCSAPGKVWPRWRRPTWMRFCDMFCRIVPPMTGQALRPLPRGRRGGPWRWRRRAA
jgi:DNA polymerase-3 subunit delta'